MCCSISHGSAGYTLWWLVLFWILPFKWVVTLAKWRVWYFFIHHMYWLTISDGSVFNMFLSSIGEKNGLWNKRSSTSQLPCRPYHLKKKKRKLAEYLYFLPVKLINLYKLLYLINHSSHLLQVRVHTLHSCTFNSFCHFKNLRLLVFFPPLTAALNTEQLQCYVTVTCC